jgi:hypothetical protein
MGGKAGNAVKTIALAAILAAVMFRPEIITGLINWMGDLIQTLLNSTGSITKQTGA